MPFDGESVVADFLCAEAGSSPQPKSQLNSCMAALTCLYQALDITDSVQNKRVNILVIGLVKSATLQSMIKTPVMSIKPFLELFEQWDENYKLSVKQLLQKHCVGGFGVHVRVFMTFRHVPSLIQSHWLHRTFYLGRIRSQGGHLGGRIRSL